MAETLTLEGNWKDAMTSCNVAPEQTAVSAVVQGTVTASNEGRNLTAFGSEITVRWSVTV